MDLEGSISFSEVIESFSKESAQARDILAKIHQQQNEGTLSGTWEPFVDTSQIPDEDKAIVKKYFENQIQRAMGKDNSVEMGEQTPFGETPALAPPQLGLQAMMARFNAVSDIKRIHRKDEQGTDANTYELMMAVLNQVPLVNFQNIFYYQEGYIFRPISDQDLRSMIFTIIEPLLAAGKSIRIIGNVLNLLRDSPYIKIGQITETPDRVFFLNGAYNLLRHELQPPRRGEFIISYIPVQCIPNDQNCPVFDDFLLRISGGCPAIITLCWEVIGYLLSNDMAAKAFFLLQGVGDSGKSVMGNLISSLFNPETVSYLDIYRFKDKFSTSQLRDKRLNISMDLPRVQLSREAIGVIKMLTGDDVITVEEKFRNAESYKPTAKLLFGSNFPLMPADNDPAFRNRLVVIPFRFPIPKEQQDKHLLEKLMAERSAIAQKALDAYLRLKANNYRFTQVDIGMTVFAGYVPDSELFRTFLEQCCVFAPYEYAYTADLLDAYNCFRTSHNVPPIMDTATFSRQLNRYCAGRISGKKRRINGQNLNGYDGIGLRMDTERKPPLDGFIGTADKGGSK